MPRFIFFQNLEQPNCSIHEQCGQQVLTTILMQMFQKKHITCKYFLKTSVIYEIHTYLEEIQGLFVFLFCLMLFLEDLILLNARFGKIPILLSSSLANLDVPF